MNITLEQREKIETFVFTKTDSITTTFKLNPDQDGEVTAIVLDIIIGSANINTVVKDIEERLEVSNEVAQKIATELDEKIFKEIEKTFGISILNPTAQPPQKNAIHDEVAVPAYVTKPVAAPEVKTEIKPAPVEPKIVAAPVVTAQIQTPETHPSLIEEREVTLRKIVTANPILNKQLEVPVVMHEKPVPKPITFEKPVETFVAAVEKVEKKEPAMFDPMPELMKPAPTTTPTPEPRKQDGPSIISTRLNSSFTLPQEEIKISNEPKKENINPIRKIDPYREPIE
jgi:hypothetical protein